MLTDTEIRARHRSRWQDLLDRYDTPFGVPANEVARVSERLRVDYITQLCDQRGLGPLPKLLRDYGVSPSVIEEVTGETLHLERRVRRSDRYQAVLDWCDLHIGQTTTVAEIAEIGGFSVSTANQFVKDRVDLFHRMKKGEYLIRNPDAERAEARH